MAEKSFGVKEINLIGASGTPTIESPNNLNLNAVNVAISTNATIGGDLTVTGNIGIAGTLTYEDVTNIDAIGIITARAGVVVGDTSNTTFRVHRTQGASNTNCGIDFNSGGSLNIFTGTSSATSRITIDNTGNIQFSTLGSTYFLLEDYVTHAGDTNTQYGFNGADSYEVKTGGSTRLTVNNSGANVVGALTVNGSALSITPTTSDIQVVYEITNQTSSSYYRFAGNGVDSSANNPDLFLERGKKYRFINNSGGNHPFRIQSDNSSTLYSTGVTNNGSNSGNIDFAPTYDSPAHLYYKCGSHPSMLGNIYISGGQYDTKPTNPIFFAFMDAQASHTSGDALKLDHTELNVGNGYNTSNYRFTPPVDGHYMFHGSANFSLSNGEFTRAANVRLYKNGSGLTYQLGRNSLTGYQSSYPQVDGTFMVHGTTSDYFTCVVTWETGGGNFSNLGSTENLHPHGTKFMGYFIG